MELLEKMQQCKSRLVFTFQNLESSSVKFVMWWMMNIVKKLLSMKLSVTVVLLLCFQGMFVKLMVAFWNLKIGFR